MKTFMLSIMLFLTAILLFVVNGLAFLLKLLPIPLDYLSKITSDFGDELIKHSGVKND